MENILGFLLINVYSLLIIIATSVVFFSKQRLKQTEDETYKNFLIANIYIIKWYYFRTRCKSRI